MGWCGDDFKNLTCLVKSELRQRPLVTDKVNSTRGHPCLRTLQNQSKVVWKPQLTVVWIRPTDSLPLPPSWREGGVRSDEEMNEPPARVRPHHNAAAAAANNVGRGCDVSSASLAPIQGNTEKRGKKRMKEQI